MCLWVFLPLARVPIVCVPCYTCTYYRSISRGWLEGSANPSSLPVSPLNGWVTFVVSVGIIFYSCLGSSGARSNDHCKIDAQSSRAVVIVVEWACTGAWDPLFVKVTIRLKSPPLWNLAIGMYSMCFFFLCCVIVYCVFLCLTVGACVCVCVHKFFHRWWQLSYSSLLGKCTSICVKIFLCI